MSPWAGRASGWLAAASAAQLVCGLLGMVLGVRHRHAYQLPGLRGHRQRVARDAVLMGTALSPPVTMLVAQAALTVSIARRPGARAARALGILGTLMVGGYAGEDLVRRRLRRAGWDPLETPLVVAGLALALIMAGTGLIRPGHAVAKATADGSHPNCR